MSHWEEPLAGRNIVIFFLKSLELRHEPPNLLGMAAHLHVLSYGGPPVSQLKQEKVNKGNIIQHSLIFSALLKVFLGKQNFGLEKRGKQQMQNKLLELKLFLNHTN